MHYYHHNIGDFNNATRHLTRLERSLYRDMIELYYDTEKQLPLDISIICRKIIADFNECSTVVEQLLNEFFMKTPNGWYHDRCESEIDIFNSSMSQKAAAGRASAAKRALKAQQALNDNPTTVEIPLNDTPTIQETRNKKQETYRDDAKIIIEYLNLKAGTKYRFVDSSLKFVIARLIEGSTVDECKLVIDRKCSDWLSDVKMKQYLRPETLFNASKFASYIGQKDMPLKAEEKPEPAPIRSFMKGII